eukprot:SAG22_NODE_2021_length_3124_cov_4.616860_3_plen_106_part_01
MRSSSSSGGTKTRPEPHEPLEPRGRAGGRALSPAHGGGVAAAEPLRHAPGPHETNSIVADLKFTGGGPELDPEQAAMDYVPMSVLPNRAPDCQVPARTHTTRGSVV